MHCLKSDKCGTFYVKGFGKSFTAYFYNLADDLDGKLPNPSKRNGALY